MNSSGTDFLIEPIPDDKYMGQRPIAVAFTKFISTTPSLRCRPSASFDVYIARIAHDCRVPRIVPYAALYFLASASRSCRCAQSASPDPDATYNEDLDESSKPPSSLGHRVSQLLHRSPLSRVRKSHWAARHFFIGPLLVALRVYQGNLDLETLAEISGFAPDELEELESAMSTCMDEDTRSAVEWMIKQGDFRSLEDVECPLVVMRRKGEAAVPEIDRSTRGPGPLKRLLSYKSLRRSCSSSCENESSTEVSIHPPPRPVPVPF